MKCFVCSKTDCRLLPWHPWCNYAPASWAKYLTNGEDLAVMGKGGLTSKKGRRTPQPPDHLSRRRDLENFISMFD